VTASTLDTTPQTSAWGVASNVETRTPLPRGYTATAQALHRAGTDPDVFAWLDHIQPAAGCTHPIRLVGTSYTVERTGPDSARILDARPTEDMPDGVIYKPCGNRRAAVCPSCAQTYRRDAFEVVRTGLVGGKGVPATVAKHPAVFPCLTAPSFGIVHTHRTTKTGRAIACRPRRHPDWCPHGIDLRCGRIHADDERILGQPFCLDCYDHDHHVIWNNQAPELWRRTTIAITRHIRRTARSRGIPGKYVRLSFGKAAEMQRRGAVHYHAVIRLDGVDPLDPTAVLPPPACLTVQDLVDAVTHAAATVAFTTQAHPAKSRGWRIRWGKEFRCPPIRITDNGEITDEVAASHLVAAGYLAKYATKSTEATGHTSRRLDTDTIDLYANPKGTHVERLVHACWTLGRPKQWRSLRRWAHMLGFGGHFLTKSRRYSVTFRLLRNRRIIWRRTESGTLAAEHSEQTTLVVNLLAYAGSGWHTTGDALLANTSAALARERRQVAREEIAHEIGSTIAAERPLAA